MHSKIQRLIAVLSEIITLLESDNETLWRDWMVRVRTYLERSDYSGIEYLLDAYGAMGSFNDLLLGQSHKDGHFAWKPIISSVVFAAKRGSWRKRSRVNKRPRTPNSPLHRTRPRSLPHFVSRRTCCYPAAGRGRAGEWQARWATDFSRRIASCSISA
jgi:uncharacterized protein DUF6966